MNQPKQEVSHAVRATLKAMISSGDAMQSWIVKHPIVKRVAYVGKFKVADGVLLFLASRGLIRQEVIRMKRQEYEITDKGRSFAETPA